MSSNRPGTPTARKLNIPQNKNSTKYIPPPLIITKPLINQTGHRNLSDLSDIDTDWKTVTQNSMECVRFPNITPPSTKKPDTNIFISAKQFRSDLFY